MRTPEQVVNELEKAEKAVADAIEQRNRLAAELANMNTFITEQMARFTGRPALSLLPDSPVRHPRPQHAGEF